MHRQWTKIKNKNIFFTIMTSVTKTLVIRPYSNLTARMTCHVDLKFISVNYQIQWFFRLYKPRGYPCIRARTSRKVRTMLFTHHSSHISHCTRILVHNCFVFCVRKNESAPWNKHLHLFPYYFSHMIHCVMSDMRALRLEVPCFVSCVTNNELAPCNVLHSHLTPY